VLQPDAHRRKIAGAGNHSKRRQSRREITMYRGSTIAMGLLFAGLGVLGLSHEASGQAGQVAQAGPPSKMVLLTDGRDFKNFDQAGNASWHIAERAIVADHGNGFLVTKEPYSDFKLRAEFWADEGTNSGIFIRCDNPQRPSAQSCYEVNIYDENPNKDNATGAIVGVAKVNPVPQTTYRWNVIEIEAKGPQLNVSINGERTASAKDTKHARGRIGLQYASGVIYFRKVEIQPLTAADIAEEDSPIYANCQAGFAIIFPGQPQARDVRYTAPGMDVPAKEYFVAKGGNRYSVTVVDFPNGPYADQQNVLQAITELGKKGQVSTRAFVEIGVGKPGAQINIAEPNGRQLRASAYSAQHRLLITQAEAAKGDTEALQFEQSIALINRVGQDLDRIAPGNDQIRQYDCRT
jgi:hypothetical protein